jgi:iron(II)-dependent oxidoreductase
VKVVDVATNEVVWTATDPLGKSDREVTEMTRRVARRLASMALSFSPVETVFFPPGSFRMGSEAGPAEEKPPHAVTVSAFYLDRTEVSAASYGAYLHALGRKASTSDSPANPATMVNWHDAQAYCGSLGMRLPTEAEWEYAARGMSDATTYPWGEAPPDHGLARFSGAAPEPVAIDALSQGASPQGVLHLAGNVAEWVGDWWDPRYYASSPSADPRGPSMGHYKVVRGGSWSQSATEIRGAARSFHSPDRGAAYIGFRCARTFIKTK